MHVCWSLTRIYVFYIAYKHVASVRRAKKSKGRVHNYICFCCMFNCHLRFDESQEALEDLDVLSSRLSARIPLSDIFYIFSFTLNRVAKRILTQLFQNSYKSCYQICITLHKFLLHLVIILLFCFSFIGFCKI